MPSPAPCERPAPGRSTTVSTLGPLPLASAAPTVAQGPRKQTSLTGVLAAHSGVPGRPRTPNSLQAHRHQGKKSASRATPESSAPFQDPGGSAKPLRELIAVAQTAYGTAPPHGRDSSRALARVAH